MLTHQTLRMGWRMWWESGGKESASKQAAINTQFDLSMTTKS